MSAVDCIPGLHPAGRFSTRRFFRYNNLVGLDDAPRFDLAVRQIVAKRLTFDHLTGKSVEAARTPETRAAGARTKLRAAPIFAGEHVSAEAVPKADGLGPLFNANGLNLNINQTVTVYSMQT